MEETAIERITREMETLENFIKLLDTAEKQNCHLVNVLHVMNDEQQDILHEFELDKFYRTEGHRKARRLQKMRQTRRVVKDTLELWMPLKEFAKTHRKLKSELRDVCNDIKHIIHEQNTRTYKPRIDTNSCIAGKHFNPTSINLEDEIHSLELQKNAQQKKL